ncbi:hypothetical protein Tco_0085565 [Tanacetum coccineum]
MAAIIAERRRKFAAQRFQDKINKPMTYAQQKDYMRTFVKNQSSTIYTTGWTLKHNLKKSLKRPGADVEKPGSKKSKSSAPPQTPVPAAPHQSSAGGTPDVQQSPFVDTPPATPPHSPKVTSHLDVTFDTSIDPTVAPTPPFATPCSVIPTGLGDVNAIYFTDKTSKYFTHLREILHLIDRQDLSKLYGIVVKHYEVKPLMKVFWQALLMVAIHIYPLSASLMKKMLKHKLEVEVDGVGNDMTYAVQLIQFIKNQLASCVPSA